MMTLGLSPALGSAPVSAPAGPNPNLLLWSEDLTKAEWTKTGCIVTADQGGTTGTADEITSTAGTCAVRQVTTTAAITGSAATATTAVHNNFVREAVTGTFDGLPYTFSVEIKDAGGGEPYTLRLDRSGGFLRASIEEPVGDGDALFQYAQLEQAAAFTSYHSRGGT